jgi:hypothetical protein
MISASQGEDMDKARVIVQLHEAFAATSSSILLLGACTTPLPPRLLLYRSAGNALTSKESLFTSAFFGCEKAVQLYCTATRSIDSKLQVQKILHIMCFATLCGI